MLGGVGRYENGDGELWSQHTRAASQGADGEHERRGVRPQKVERGPRGCDLTRNGGHTAPLRASIEKKQNAGTARARGTHVPSFEGRLPRRAEIRRTTAKKWAPELP